MTIVELMLINKINPKIIPYFSLSRSTIFFVDLVFFPVIKPTIFFISFISIFITAIQSFKNIIFMWHIDSDRQLASLDSVWHEATFVKQQMGLHSRLCSCEKIKIIYYHLFLLWTEISCWNKVQALMKWANSSGN